VFRICFYEYFELLICGGVQTIKQTNRQSDKQTKNKLNEYVFVHFSIQIESIQIGCRSHHQLSAYSPSMTCQP
jgi:hypothetical protein